MALADILAAMEAEVEAECRSIAGQAAAHAAQIRADAQQERERIRNRHRQSILVPLQQERARRLNRARLAGLQAKSRARERLFTEALAEARQRLAHLRQTPGYSGILRALAEEALAQLDGPAVLHADPADADLLRCMLPGTQIVDSLRTMGGVAAHSLDGRIVVVNTLEARLEQAEVILRQKVMPLFDEAGHGQL